MEANNTRPATAVALERWRVSAGLSRQRLADLADVSATYVRTIEAGVDDLEREVVPSAAIMQKLAHGLALALAGEDEARRETVERAAYAELMAAAGYLPESSPPSPAPPSAGPPGPAETMAPLRPSRLRESVASRYGGPAQMVPLFASDLAGMPAAEVPSVALRDPRLHEHARDLLEHWETLDPDDQTLLLGIMAWVHERRRNTSQTSSGGI